MRLGVQISLLVLACLAGNVLPGRADEPVPPFLYTRQTSFSIPFQVDRAALANRSLAEVQLHLSTDRGEHWEVHERVPPEKGSFVYRAPHDGEYWFCVRSQDKQGKILPTAPPTAGLVVLVDTLSPRLDVTAQRLPSGEITAQWQVVDPNLKPETLKLEYRTSDTAPWQELAASGVKATQGPSTVVGEGTWWVQGATGPISLRVQVTDRSGNPAVNQVVVQSSGTTKVEGLAVNNSDQRPTALPVSSAAATDTSVSKNIFDRYRSHTEPTDTAASPPPSEPLPASRPWPAQGDGKTVLPQREQEEWRVASQSQGSRSSGFLNTSASATANAITNRGSSLSSDAGFDFADLSPAERPKMVNSRTFQVEYEVESVGSAGIAKVELFGTRDGGKSWTSLGVDPDNRSPLVVTVNGEGLYGFSVTVQSASGLGGGTPRTGQRPELWIGVDLTKPTATLTGAEPGNNPDELVIYWEARDRRLEGRPISLYFGEKPGGPWGPIAAGLENTGSYTWRMDSRVKDKIVLKLEARDAAGNIAEFETATPILLNRQLPQGRIRDVRPLSSDSLNQAPVPR
jgi:hypothetical protein